MRDDVREELDRRGLKSVESYFPGPNPNATAEEIVSSIAKAEKDIWAGRAWPVVDLDGKLTGLSKFIAHGAEDVFFRHNLSTHRPLGWALSKIAKIAAR